MAGGRAVVWWLVVVVVGAAAMLMNGAHAAQYNVGGDSGWSLNVNYTAWAEKYEYLPGDSLFFKYTSPSHTVLQVTKEDYKECKTSNALFSDGKGNTTFSLSAEGQYWFICGVGDHCSKEMKFTINVLSSTSAAPASPGPSSPDSASNIINPIHLLSFLLFLVPLASFLF
ncbi:hypothetical protein GOP47_0014533 [Adiantum capillus-veneris]|uniref:Phytocyanin domain-containing protein n=1 Tax=Adiantum capillus-veneris TaxID=13818 RepID=A0A9D4ULN9_ADICA|nr:hypothetical protein GOP47_0014532 [Adiantum capillus-veneris]KAI5070190.1 hypothetical protein GOP47_0014533 [Adiantum capillus-veneris]